MQKEYRYNAGIFWDRFYTQHENRFFKDRHWLFTEFPELLPAGDAVATAMCNPSDTNEDIVSTISESDRWGRSAAAKTRVLELGCGAGNTVFPLVKRSTNFLPKCYCAKKPRTGLDGVILMFVGPL